MKYKTLLLLVLTLILTKTVYGKVLDSLSAADSGDTNVYQWGEDVNMRITPNGSFVESSLLYNSLNTLNGNIWWLGNVPMLDTGLNGLNGSFNITLGVNGEVISASFDFGGNGSCSLKIMPGENGSAALYLEYTGAMGGAVKVGGTYLKFLCVIYKEYPNLRFDKQGNQLDKNLKPIPGAKTKAQLDAERAAGGGSGGGAGGGGGVGSNFTIFLGVYYPSGVLTGTTYLVYQNGQQVGQAIYYSDGTIVISPKATPDGKPPVTADQLKKAIDKYRSE